jgi:hypothetical protein
MTPTPDFYILPAEFVGHAACGSDGKLRIGEGDHVVEVDLAHIGSRNKIGVYVRRSSNDLSVIEIHMARHDGLAQEQLDAENAEAERYPLGVKEYWRGKMVGKYTYNHGHPMTDEEFEEDWWEGESEDDHPSD